MSSLQLLTYCPGIYLAGRAAKKRRPGRDFARTGSRTCCVLPMPISTRLSSRHAVAPAELLGTAPQRQRRYLAPPAPIFQGLPLRWSRSGRAWCSQYVEDIQIAGLDGLVSFTDSVIDVLNGLQRATSAFAYTFGPQLPLVVNLRPLRRRLPPHLILASSTHLICLLVYLRP